MSLNSHAAGQIKARPELQKAAAFISDRCQNASPESSREVFLIPGRDQDGCKYARIEDSTGYELGAAALFEKCRWYGATITFQIFAMVSGHKIQISPQETGEDVALIEIDGETAELKGWTRKWFKPLTFSLITPDGKSSLLIWSDSWIVSDSNIHFVLDGGPVHHLPVAGNRIFPATCQWDGNLFVLAAVLFVKMQATSFMWGSFC